MDTEFERPSITVKLWHTSLYGSKAGKIVGLAIGNAQIRATGSLGFLMRCSSMHRSADGEVCVRIGVQDEAEVDLLEQSIKSSKHFGDAEICENLAKYLRLRVIEKCHAWRRDSDQRLPDFDKCEAITVAHAYAAYAALKGRTKQIEKMSKSMKKAIIGTQNDPAATEFESVKHEEIVKAWKEYDEAVAKADKEYNKSYNEASKEFHRKNEKFGEIRDVKLTAAIIARDERLKKLEEKFTA